MVRRVNAFAATAFVIGGSLFAIGAALAQGDVGGPRLAAGVYLLGGVFFCTGGGASVRLSRGRPPLEQLSALVLFAGTLVFAINLLDSLIGDLTPVQFDRLVWSPDMVGCALFLVSGHFAMVALSGSWLPCWRPRDLGWRIVALNQLGSILFMVSAVATFVRARRRHDRRRHRQLGHPDRRPLLRPRRRAPGVRAPGLRGCRDGW